MPTSATGSRKQRALRSQRHLHHQRHQSGVTLIETLVGLVVVSVLLGATMMAFPRTGERRTDLAAEQAAALIALACERAELTGRDIGMKIDGQRLVFARLQARQWRAFADSPQEALRPRALDAQTRLELRVDDSLPLASAGASGTPPLVCLATGEMTPFVLAIEGPARRRWLIRGDPTGKLSRTQSDVF